MATVQLGGAEYDLPPLSIKASKLWRALVEAPINDITATISGMEEIELTQMSDVAGLIEALKGTLLGAPDIIVDLLFAYSADLRAKRDDIEDSATNEEAVIAFIEAVKQEFPISPVMNLMQPRGANRR